MVKDYVLIDEVEEYVKLKNLVIAHCDNSLRTLKGDGTITVNSYFFSKNAINTLDGKIADFFKNPSFEETPDFRYTKMEKNFNPVVNK